MTYLTGILPVIADGKHPAWLITSAEVQSAWKFQHMEKQQVSIWLSDELLFKRERVQGQVESFT